MIRGCLGSGEVGGVFLLLNRTGQFVWFGKDNVVYFQNNL
jgi:hypothetical protein